MATDLHGWIDVFAGLRVLVVGGAILDSYLEGGALRFCREAPVPNVTVARRVDTPGGAANAAANARALGARVTLLSVAGNDPEGGFLRRALRARGVDPACVLSQPGRRTRAKHRVVSGARVLLAFDSGTATPLDAPTEHRLIHLLSERWSSADAVLVSDYGDGVVTAGVIAAIARLQAACPRVVVADSRHRLPAFREAAVTAVKPSFEEAAELLGEAALRGPDRADAVIARRDELLARTGASLVAVTLDHDGAVLLPSGAPPVRVFCRDARGGCPAGAGDTFVAALGLGLAAGAPAAAAGELAVAAAGLAAAKEGTATCSAAELRACFTPAAKYEPSLRRLAARVEAARRGGRRVVFTNGCFDLLHSGHVALLHRAKELGDVLVVALNSDAGIRRLKGPGRPINSLEDRIQVISALACVDLVTSFDEDTADLPVRALRPDLFVKGGDFSRDTLPEAPLVESLGGAVHILPCRGGRSTAGLLARIRSPRDLGRGP